VDLDLPEAGHRECNWQSCALVAEMDATIAGAAALLGVGWAFLRKRSTGDDRLPHEAQFGEAIRGEFELEAGTVHLNNGSFGSVPRSVGEHRLSILARIEAYPDRFFRKQALPEYIRECNWIGEKLGAEPGALAFVENATSGVNAALNSVDFKPGDRILMFEDTYNACRNAVYEVCRRTGAEAVVGRLPLPIRSEEDIVSYVLGVIDKAGPFRVLLLDEITSPTAVVVPVQRICTICRERGILTIVDGAHSPGQLDLRLAETGADWYTANLHKWAFAPRGCAILYAAPPVQGMTQPVITSHCWGVQSFQTRFFTQGTNDQSRYLSAKAAWTFLDPRGGFPAAREYQRALLSWAVGRARAAWEHLPDPNPEGIPTVAVGSLLAPLDMCGVLASVRTPLPVEPFLRAEGSVTPREAASLGSLRTVSQSLAAQVASGALPTSAVATPPLSPDGVWQEAECDEMLAERIARVIIIRGGVQPALFVTAGSVWLRFSVAVYTCREDVEAAIQAVRDLATLAHSTGNTRGSFLSGDALLV
jgi:isopenicillin-N epimerase